MKRTEYEQILLQLEPGESYTVGLAEVTRSQVDTNLYRVERSGELEGYFPGVLRGAYRLGEAERELERFGR